MRFQSNGYHCGPASVQNALLAKGCRISQRRLANAAGVESKCPKCQADMGDDWEPYACEHGIRKAIRYAGYHDRVMELHKAREAWIVLRDSLQAGHPIVACVDRFEHWVCVFGLLGERVLIFDCARYGYNLKNNGVHSVSRQRFLKRWRAARKDLDEYSLAPFYGIAVGPKL